MCHFDPIRTTDLVSHPTGINIQQSLSTWSADGLLDHVLMSAKNPIGKTQAMLIFRSKDRFSIYFYCNVSKPKKSWFFKKKHISILLVSKGTSFFMAEALRSSSLG